MEITTERREHTSAVATMLGAAGPACWKAGQEVAYPLAEVGGVDAVALHFRG